MLQDSLEFQILFGKQKFADTSVQCSVHSKQNQSRFNLLETKRSFIAVEHICRTVASYIGG